MKVGIDYSMSCPCIYVKRDDGSEKWYLIQEVLRLVQDNDTICIKRHPKYASKLERAIYVADWAINILKSEGVTELNLESFSMGSTSGQATYDIGAHSGILYMKIHEAGIKVNFIPPTTNKKAFFGMGNAGKPEMCEKFYQVHGARFYEILGTKQYETPENDMVDAYSIAHCDVRLDEKAAKKMFM